MTEDQTIPGLIARDTTPRYDADRNKTDTLGHPLVMDFSRKEHTYIIAKSGSGKSYAAGVLSEEMVPPDANYAAVIIDPLGIFGTLGLPNDGDEVDAWNKEVGRTEIVPAGLENYKVWIPAGDQDAFEPEMYHQTFALGPSQITYGTLCYAFDLDPLEPQINLYRKAQRMMYKRDPEYSFGDLYMVIREEGRDLGFQTQTIDALTSKMDALAELNIVARRGWGVDLHDMIRPGQVIVFDLSMSSSYTAKIVLNFFTEKLLTLRKLITKRLCHAKRAGEKVTIPYYIPPVQLIIDEAHNYFPRNPTLKRFVKEGRNVGCMLTAISQSPDLTRDVYANIVHLFVGQLVFEDDINRVRAMLPVAKSPREFQREVKSLDVGNFLYYNIDTKTERKVRIRPRRTLHPAKTEIEDERKYLTNPDPQERFFTISKQDWGGAD